MEREEEPATPRLRGDAIQHILALTKNPLMSEFTGERIVERLTEKDLVKLQKIMKKQPSFSIATFLRIFRNILQPTPEEDFYLSYGLFRLFQEACLKTKKSEVSFDDISNLVSDKIPSQSNELRITQKLLPMGVEIPEAIKKKLFAPQVMGKVLEERERLEESLHSSDRFLHINRRVRRSVYSPGLDMFATIDFPSTEIKLLNSRFQLIQTISTEMEISRREAIISWIAWSEKQQRLAALLGDYSISLWAHEDKYSYEVNVPLPVSQLLHPYCLIGYMESSERWYAMDQRPAIYLLSSYNFESEYQFTHFKMVKENPLERILTDELKYRKLLCVAFEKNLFLVSLDKKELITQLRPFKTNITSVAFNETYQALFVSNYDNAFHSYELTEHMDLTEKGRFEGHKALVSQIGTLQNRPVVFSIDERSLTKLWDIRDFKCYQTFQGLKNVHFHQMLHTHDAVILIGSKHFCYKWQRFSQKKESEKVVMITQLEKNVLVVTSSEVRLFSHNNGVLIRVLKGVFSHAPILRACLIDIRKLLLLVNEDGECKFYDTGDFSLVGMTLLPPKMVTFSYEKTTQLLTYGCMGEISVSDFKEVDDLPAKRKIHNKKDILQFCQVSQEHDIIAAQYQPPHLFFYSYERCKPLGFLLLDNFVTLYFMPGRRGVIILCKDRLLFMKYTKTPNNLTFFLKKHHSLWQSADIQHLNLNFKLREYDELTSQDLVVMEETLIVTSNEAGVQCKIWMRSKLMGAEKITVQSKENYNPYRIASEDHNQCFDMTKPALVIEEKVDNLLLSVEYLKSSNKKETKCMAAMNSFYCVADTQQLTFYDLEGRIKGKLDFKETLPIVWDLHNYSEEEVAELQFVMEFIQKDQLKQGKQADSLLLTNPNLQRSEELITMSMFGTKAIDDRLRSTSLREKKMVLEKERDERQKYQNFMEVRKNEQNNKLKNTDKHTNEKYISESLLFLNVNRNKMLLSKNDGPELPQIKAFEAKLNAIIKRDEKKSMMSKYSGAIFESPLKKIVEEEAVTISKEAPKSLMSAQLSRQNYKDTLRRLDSTLKQSKFQHKGRSGSLPQLTRIRSDRHL